MMDSSPNEGGSVEKQLREELRSKDEEIINLRKTVQDLKVHTFYKNKHIEYSVCNTNIESKSA